MDQRAKCRREWSDGVERAASVELREEKMQAAGYRPLAFGNIALSSKRFTTRNQTSSSPLHSKYMYLSLYYCTYKPIRYIMFNQPIDRRKFIQQSGTLMGTASLLALGVNASPSVSSLKMGLQLFTVRDALAKDIHGSLKKIAALGYQDLETYGFDPVKTEYYGMKAAAFKQLLDDHKLSASSGHYDLYQYLSKPEEELDRYVDACIVGAHALGQRYITWPWLDPDSRSIEKFKLLAQKLNIVGERVTKAGLGFAYHNHDFEFIDHNGENGYDIIMRDTDASLVKLQIDLYWAVHSSRLTPAQLFSKQPGRFVMWHVKDMDKKTRDYTELGNGSIDYTVILPEAKRAGLQYYFIEQGGNFAKDSMQSITDSAIFFRKNLQRYLTS
jgi:sugar phosphate isomerase/epimerase